jgi:hypothetical protein
MLLQTFHATACHKINFSTVTSAGTGDVKFTGMPFTESGVGGNGNRYVVQTNSVSATSYANVYAFNVGSASISLLAQTNGSGWTVLSPSNFTVAGGSIVTVCGVFTST